VSFILDALRKSENERQRSAVPSISQVPFAVPRHRLPVWALALIVLLGMAVLALGGAWWKSSGTVPDAPIALATPTPTVNVPIEIPAPSSVEQRSAPPRAAQTPNGLATRTLANLAQDRGSAATNGAAELLATEVSASNESIAAATGRWQTLPTASELVAQGISLPPLRLELHVFYRDRPADRFVIINGSTYHEGEVMTEGPRVVTIESTGAVVNHQGREFLLSPE